MKQMDLPLWVLDCLESLEQAGYAAWAVGGCVRDGCLLKEPHDYDLCTAALPEQTRAVFENQKLILAGEKHGTVGVVTSGGVVEITTFRREGTYQDNRHPDFVDFVADVEEDLSRRDFTINAMAYSPKRGFCDPFGGREDLKNGILRAVGDPVKRFREDALRILRGVRFAIRFHLKVDEATLSAMESEAGLLDHLARERVFEELSGILPIIDRQGMETFAPVLTAAIPQLAPMVGFDQRSPYHAYDLYTHTALVVDQVPKDLPLRWAALLHDVGKVPSFTLDEEGIGHFYGHDRLGAQMADEILKTLKSPTALREQAVTLITQHMNPLPEDRKQLRRRISRLGWELSEKLFYLQRADQCSKGGDEKKILAYFSSLRDTMEEIRKEDACLKLSDLSVNGYDLMALGYEGREIGHCLQHLFDLVLEEQVPNEREALLKEAKKERNTPPAE